MLNAGASVSVCHILTKDISFYTKNADIVCVGVGKPDLIKASMLKKGAVVVDIGINHLNDGCIVGDVDFINAQKVAGFITPVPKGVESMTIVSLLENTLIAFEKQQRKRILMKFLRSVYAFCSSWVGTIIIVLLVIFFCQRKPLSFPLALW